MTKHLKFLGTLPCVICGNPHETEACHVRYTEPKVDKVNPGIGAKVADWFAVPMCSAHHRDQHQGNERLFWAGHRIEPHLVSLALFMNTGDHAACCRIIDAHRSGR